MFSIRLVMINAILLNVVYHAGRMQPLSTDSAKERSILHYSAVCTCAMNERILDDAVHNVSMYIDYDVLCMYD